MSISGGSDASTESLLTFETFTSSLALDARPKEAFCVLCKFCSRPCSSSQEKIRVQRISDIMTLAHCSVRDIMATQATQFARPAEIRFPTDIKVNPLSKIVGRGRA